MPKRNENTALTVQKSGFAALADANFNTTVSEELDGLDLGFERIKIINNANVYSIPSEGDDAVTVPEFSAVILHQHALNAYYKTTYKGGSAPPDCGSFDGKAGVGDPGGKCAVCPYNQYGSGENGISKACKNRRRIYILREGEMFPMLISLPPASLKAFTKYLKSLLSRGKSSNSVVTRFSLKQATSGKMTYSQTVFKIDRYLTPEEMAAIRPVSEQIKIYAANAGFEDDGSADDEPLVDIGTGEVIEPLGVGNNLFGGNGNV